MAVFDVNSAQRGVPTFRQRVQQGQALRANLAATQADTELRKKQIASYDAELKLDQEREARLAQEQQVNTFKGFLETAAPAIRAGNVAAIEKIGSAYGLFKEGDTTDTEELKQLQEMVGPEDPKNSSQTERILSDLKERNVITQEEYDDIALKTVKGEYKVSGTTVNVGDQDAFQKKRGENDAKRLAGMQELAHQAQSQQGSLDLFEAALDEGAQTGTLQPALIYVKGALADVGFEFDDDLPLQEQIQSLEVSGALGRISETKGPVSDREMAMFIRSVPNLAKSEEGNRLMIEFLRWKNSVTIDSYKLADQAGDPDAVLDMEITMPKELMEKIKEAGKTSEEPETIEVNGVKVTRRKAG